MIQIFFFHDISEKNLQFVSKLIQKDIDANNLPATISAYCKKKNCFKCGCVQPIYEKEGLSIMAKWNMEELTEDEKKEASKRFNAKMFLLIT